MALGKRVNMQTGAVETFDYTPDVRVPRAVTRRQAKLALLAGGHLASVEAAIGAADTATQIAWSDALSFDRTDPLVLAIGGSLGLSSGQIDALFQLAETL